MGAGSPGSAPVSTVGGSPPGGGWPLFLLRLWKCQKSRKIRSWRTTVCGPDACFYKRSFIGTVMHPMFIYCLWLLLCYIGVVEYSRSSNNVLFSVILLYVILL